MLFSVYVSLLKTSCHKRRTILSHSPKKQELEASWFYGCCVPLVNNGREQSGGGDTKNGGEFRTVEMNYCKVIVLSLDSKRSVSQSIPPCEKMRFGTTSDCPGSSEERR